MIIQEDSISLEQELESVFKRIAESELPEDARKQLFEMATQIKNELNDQHSK
jgi:hypothetical protein